MKKIAVSLALMLIIIIAAATVSAVINANAKAVGADIGSGMGTLAGAAAGSFDGFTKGLSEGTEAGKTAGLSARDTTAELSNEIRRIGKLNILEMDVTLTDVFSIGAEQNKPDTSTGYMALLVWEGTASYTVDLEQCSVSNEGDAVKIFVPRPVLRVTIDPEKTRKRAESNASVFNNGSSLAAYTAYINSMDMTENKVREGLVGYATLKETAENAAKATIERLANSVVLNSKKITVEFIGIEEIIT